MCEDLPTEPDLFFHKAGEFREHSRLGSYELLKLRSRSGECQIGLFCTLLFLYELPPAFPDLADPVDTFLPCRKLFAIPFIEFMAVSTLHNKVDLGLINLLLFPLLDPRHGDRRIIDRA